MTPFSHSAKFANGRFPLRDRQQRVGYGPSLRGDERRLRRETGRSVPARQLALCANSSQSRSKKPTPGLTGVKPRATNCVCSTCSHSISFSCGWGQESLSGCIVDFLTAVATRTSAESRASTTMLPWVENRRLGPSGFGRQ